MSAFKSFEPMSLARALLAPQALFALLGIIAFSVTIIHPEDILPREAESGMLGRKELILYSPDCLKEAESMEPARLLATSQPERAIKAAFALAATRSHHVISNICAGNVLIETGPREEGFRLLKRSVALEPTSRYVRLNLAEKLEKCRRYEEAISQYRLISQGYPHWAKPHQAMGEIYLKTDRPELAANELKSTLEYEPNNGTARKLRGIALGRAGLSQKALEEYFMGDATEQNLTGLPSDVNQQLKMWGSLDKAVFQTRQELRLRPDDAMTKLRLGRILMYAGDAQEAKSLLLEARKGAPADPEIHRNLALVLRKLGETNLALSEFMLSINLEKAKEKAKEEQ